MLTFLTVLFIRLFQKKIRPPFFWSYHPWISSQFYHDALKFLDISHFFSCIDPLEIHVFASNSIPPGIKTTFVLPCWNFPLIFSTPGFLIFSESQSLCSNTATSVVPSADYTLFWSCWIKADFFPFYSCNIRHNYKETSWRICWRRQCTCSNFCKDRFP